MSVTNNLNPGYFSDLQKDTSDQNPENDLYESADAFCRKFSKSKQVQCCDC